MGHEKNNSHYIDIHFLYSDTRLSHCNHSNGQKDKRFKAE